MIAAGLHRMRAQLPRYAARTQAASGKGTFIAAHARRPKVCSGLG
ncbi:hypothetical protein SAMCFNEI73_pC1359 (plasmid) [Sinorhizobium americanum]|uniref:Uncharacterized protein n=1 Tax=Sinorhizobium americanum TaxID=194963 RepID=A0A1L3LY69_9HYPH|nr:hypothetical protein SAMCFNEI73_pC1359 [Sinorhizobium americanum]